MNMVDQFRSITEQGYSRDQLKRIKNHNEYEKSVIYALLKERKSNNKFRYLDNQLKMLKLEYYYIIKAITNTYR